MQGNAKINSHLRHDPGEVKRMWENLRDEVKRQYPIDKAIEDLTPSKLRRAGNIMEACCPFHVERSASFKVDVARGTYKCFGVGCNASGDVLVLIQDTQNLNFQAAMIFGADRAGIQVPEVLRKIAKGRSAGPRQEARRMVKYPDAKPIVTPSELGDPSLTVIPQHIRRPLPGRDFRLWSNGGQRGDKDFEQVSYRPQMVHEYRDIDNNHLMSILRIQGRDRKFFIPARLMVPAGACPSHLIERHEQDGKAVAWVSVGPSTGDFKPVYGMEDVRAWLAKGGRNILIVEGEKTRDAAKRLIASADPEGRWLVLTPMGGSKSAIYADWRPLIDAIRGRPVNVVTWPDADKLLERPDGSKEDRLENAVMQVLSSFGQRAIDLGAIEKIILGRVTPPADVESGWDLADAEKEGWSGERVIGWIREHSRRVREVALTLREDEPAPAPEQDENRIQDTAATEAQQAFEHAS